MALFCILDRLLFGSLLFSSSKDPNEFISEFFLLDMQEKKMDFQTQY